ncbi:sensor histidine kinase [Pseudonocardia aurantiaca]|uniref:histidine kinase n=1 Tax=Pseudonocardia aurantiaca TaxID=75290 RepID=A0ABW4FR06_9PSEU
MTTIETGPTWSERLDPRNWTLAWKLVVVGLVPAILALVLGVLRVADQAGVAADLGRSTRLLQVQQQVAGAADALRQERDEATLFVAGNRAGDRGVLEIGFGQADGQIDEMLGAVRGASELDPTTLSALQQTEGELSQLQPLRTDSIDNFALTSPQIRVRYDEVVEGIDVLDRALLRQLRTPGIAGLADALTAVTNAGEQLAVQHTVLGAAIRSGRLGGTDTADTGSTDAQLSAAFREYQVALTPDQLTRFGNFLDDAANSQRERLKAAIVATPPDRPIAIVPSEWDTAYNGSRAAAERSADLLRNELVAGSVAAEEQASNLAGINSVVLMLGLLLGIAVAVLIARALIRSLRVLRTSALDVAERRLPRAVESMRSGETPDVVVDPVPLSGRDEVGQVARAFDAVHGQAVRLAADQAALQSNVSAMFVNLSRRSQALVERQLQLIEQLESNEQDPDQLSNLFQLDHLATRMRRNSENLLVLAGTDLAKRNIAPVPMVDVLRAAVSEIEQYQRIVVQTPPTAKIQGRSASDLVHLLAELLDNATNFSPPDSQVVMSTARTTDGSIVVEIADRGVGMADHELSDANQRLSGPSSVDVSASRRMGLFVVGRLAARHGFGVRLITSSAGGPGGGLTALVTVPAHLIPSTEPAEVRPLGIPQPAGVQGGRPGAQPQRGPGAINGTARAGGLSALVAGTDGPSNPTGVFDAPARQDGQLFTPSPQNTQNNGASNPLPSRRPGSTLRPDGPPLPPTPPDRREPSAQSPDPGDAERAAEDRAREIAQQARRDQEAAAAKAAAERAAKADQQGPRNGASPDAAQHNGSHSEPGEQVSSNGTGPRDETGTSKKTGAEERAAPAAAEQQAPAEERPAEPRRPSGLPQRIPRGSAPVSPPTMPMPLINRPPIAPSGQSAPAQQQGEQAAAAQQAGPEQVGPEQAGPEQAGPEQVGLERARSPLTGANQPGLEQPGPAQEQDSSQQPAALQGEQQPSIQAEQPGAAQTGATQTGATQAAPQQTPAPPQAPKPLPPPRPAPRSQPAAPVQPFGQAAPSDELFAPSVPVIGEPGSRGAAEARQAEAFDLGETTPIFEEIASAWFRSNRPIPVDWESTQDDGIRLTESPAAAAPPAAPSTPSAFTPPAAPPPAAADRPAEEREQAAPAPQPPTEQDFATVADEGWRAASDIVAERQDELTAAGLPKRRPRARLVPGSAGSAVLAPPVSSARSAETIRGRLASYQQGVRQGRESRLRGEQGTASGANGGSGTGPAGDAGGKHDEESS